MRCAHCDYCDAVITEKNINKAVKIDGLCLCSDECLQDYIDQNAEAVSIYDLTDFCNDNEDLEEE